MGYGQGVDWLAGTLSRLLHVRGARDNTVGELGPYLDLAPDALFEPPPPITDLRVERTLLDRARRVSTLRWTSTYRPLTESYRRRHERDYPENLTAWARWLRPDRSPRKRCLVYVHGWLEPGSWAEEVALFPRWSRELDVDLAHVALPFHGRRQSKSSLFSGEWFWTADLVRSVEGVRQAAADARAICSWFQQQGYTDVGVTGLSLGGAICMLLACLEPAPDFCIPLLAHLRLEEAVEHAPILWRMKHDLERWGIDHDQRRELFRRLGWSSYRPVLARDRQLWVQAHEDVYIGKADVVAQWHDWGQPPIEWIDGGHMTFPLQLENITRHMGAFLRELPPTRGR